MAPIKRRFSDHEWLEDVAAMVSTMKTTHPNLFHDASETDFGCAVTDLSAQTSMLIQDTSEGDHRLCIVPHIPAAFSSSDYFGLRDPAMERVMETIRCE